MNATFYHDAFARLAGAGGKAGTALVRILSLAQGNRYSARAVEFTPEGNTQDADQRTMEVINIAEPASQAGQLSAGLLAVAIDVEGRWVIHVRSGGGAMFPAKIISSSGSAAYVVREQVPAAGGGLADRQGAVDVQAVNLAEMTMGPGAAVDVGQIVLVTAIAADGTPPTIRYYFDHPAYAKYL